MGDKCIPLVREITFENAEELTEEGLPFLILFRIVGDMNNEKIFNDAVIRELYDQKSDFSVLEILYVLFLIDFRKKAFSEKLFYT